MTEAAPPMSTSASTRPTDSSAAPTEETILVPAPESERVDLTLPTFSNPTAITNPAGATLRFEVTLLPETRTIEWNGQQVETLVSQFITYEDGRVLEVAVDFFAQADDGAVWYFGRGRRQLRRRRDRPHGRHLAGRQRRTPGG